MATLDHGKKLGLVTFGWDTLSVALEWIDLHRNRNLTSEQQLMLALLEDAIDSLGSGNNTLRNESISWIMHNDWEYPLSFNNCCEGLKLNPSAVRDKLRRVYQQAA